MPLVPSNAMVVKPQELGNIAVKPGVFLRDVAPVIEDATDIPTGYALVNGRRAVYILVTKRADASTLDVVNSVRADLPKMQARLARRHQGRLRVRPVALRHQRHQERRLRGRAWPPGSSA